MVCNKLGHVVRDVEPQKVGLAADDGDAGLKIRRLNVGGQAPLHTGAQPVLQAFDLFRRAVTGQYDLLARVVQRVEGVEKFFLR
ncbi:hypothetical protein SDC9_153505 [bioreactor metagenome]|uniref:Uncharacterized protein n=1 Tax=bioreactor metagenome TaxID=1076179 RepID=A0A645EYJ7_9ZZZZ